MKEPITQQDTTLNKEEFVKGVIYLMRLVAHSRASSITFSSTEVVAFANHLYEYVVGLRATSDINVEKLTRALIATHGKYLSMQDQAAAIKALL